MCDGDPLLIGLERPVTCELHVYCVLVSQASKFPSEQAERRDEQDHTWNQQADRTRALGVAQILL
jgi:hypothetical protein